MELEARPVAICSIYGNGSVAIGRLGKFKPNIIIWFSSIYIHHIGVETSGGSRKTAAISEASYRGWNLKSRIAKIDWGIWIVVAWGYSPYSGRRCGQSARVENIASLAGGCGRKGIGSIAS